MYLEISNVAAALGKNPYESRYKILLISWARHCPLHVLKYLIDNNCIQPLKENEETFSKLQTDILQNILPNEFDVNDFSTIEHNVLEEYKLVREGKQTDSELKQLKEYTHDTLKKNNGCLQEDNIINKEKYIKGNDKMYYLNISDNACIGGKNDAFIEDILLEIKTRTRKQNVRKNEYDLYQLICYLLATGIDTGKIVQIYNKEKFDSDTPNEKEYGIINIKNEPWVSLVDEIKTGLIEYFNELDYIIKTSNYKYLSTVIPQKIRPIAKYVDNFNELCEENIKFKNLFRHLVKY